MSAQIPVRPQPEMVLVAGQPGGVEPLGVRIAIGTETATGTGTVAVRPLDLVAGMRSAVVLGVPV